MSIIYSRLNNFIFKFIGSVNPQIYKMFCRTSDKAQKYYHSASLLNKFCKTNIAAAGILCLPRHFKQIMRRINRTSQSPLQALYLAQESSISDASESAALLSVLPPIRRTTSFRRPSLSRGSICVTVFPSAVSCLEMR